MTSATDEDATPAREESTASLAAELADELESGTVPDAEVQRLRAALLDGDSGALAARVEKLQRDVDEVLAYASALEEFLNEHGAGEQLIEAVHDDLENVRGDVDDVRTDLDETRTDLEAELERLDSDVESLHEWRTQLATVLSGPDFEAVDE